MSPSRVVVLTALLTSAIVGCKEQPSTQQTPPAHDLPVASALSVRALPQLPPTASYRASPTAKNNVEVELSGSIELSAGQELTGMIEVFVSVEDCAKPGAPVLRKLQVRQPGRFFVEVFAPFGTELRVCASAEGKSAKGSGKLFGKAQRSYRAEGVGEVIFDDARIVLAPQPAP